MFKKLLNYKDLIHCYTKKPFNFNENLVTKMEIQDYYKVISCDFDYSFTKIKKCIQGHTNTIKVVNEDTLDDNFINVDGMITNLNGVALVTYLADCQAILLYDPIMKVIGNIHSGWKGTLNKIISNAINTMVDKFECNVDNIVACICPSILDCCFEVDEDVMIMFKKNFSNYEDYIFLGEIKENKQKYFIDTVKINIDIMKKLGLKDGNIVSSNICTKCSSNIYYSYRKESNNSGRNIAIICLK